MRVTNFKLVAGAALLSMAMATVASAQATRTWVSGVGDDVNPCSRTAPCKTWAGAISKTAGGGEIDALDPGGFGAVTCTKSITLEGAGTQASILNPGFNGVVVSAAGITVNLRNLSINGAGTGLNAVNVVNAAHVNIHNLAIFGNTHAVNVAVAGVKVVVDDTKMFNNVQTAFVVSPGGANTTVELNNCDLSNNGVSAGTAGGLFAQSASVLIKNSILSNNTAPGVQAGSGGSIFVDSSDLSFNSNGAQADSGGTIRLSRSTITGCTNAISATGSVLSYGDNRIGGNTTNNGTGITGAVPGLQ